MEPYTATKAEKRDCIRNPFLLPLRTQQVIGMAHQNLTKTIRFTQPRTNTTKVYKDPLSSTNSFAFPQTQSIRFALDEGASKAEGSVPKHVVSLAFAREFLCPSRCRIVSSSLYELPRLPSPPKFAWQNLLSLYLVSSPSFV